ncbi:right-handed parallel beta-helix repeat-containing protein [Pseudonocardia acaciae]|uniref:right-handed parallel beta-helix repeat-containing protein n=1 Tax=Pseudonocardia acaciae TaxID=551276 RepID=UPI0012EECEB0|nr:right-handed parallel beta-helix repeat-containing protein [Pseudonocardia acaciae]
MALRRGARTSSPGEGHPVRRLRPSLLGVLLAVGVTVAAAVSPTAAGVRLASAATVPAEPAPGQPSDPAPPTRPTPPPRPSAVPGLGVIDTPPSQVPAVPPYSTVPSAPVVPAVPSPAPAAPSAVPAVPAAPSVVPAAPSAVPAVPSPVPAAPSVAPEAPSAIPAPPVAPSAVPAVPPAAVPAPVPSVVPNPPAAVPGVPSVPPPAAPTVPTAPTAPATPATSAYCAESWGLGGAVGGVLGALGLPEAAAGVELCGAGAVRPAPAQVECGKVVDGAGLQAAVDAAVPGDRICLQGSSGERLKVTKSGTEAAPIQVVGDGQGTIKGINIKADHVIVRGFNVTDPSAPGIEMTGNGITLLNNTVTAPRGADGDGIRFFGTNLKILHNTVSDVRNLGGAHADCMQTFATSTPASKGVLIHSNRCEKIDNQCLIAEGPNSSAGDGSGKGESSDIIFTNNFCDSHASQAVMIDDVKNVTVTLNEITGGNKKAFAFDNKSTGAKVNGNRIAQGIGFEVGMDTSSKTGYEGPQVGGAP